MSERVVVIGAGIVGLAAAHRLQVRRPGIEVLVIDKESEPAHHQTGRNSGVIHSGLYYAPGSLKAQTCRAGREALLELAAAEGVAHEVCGKVVVAVDESEIPRLDELERRGRANGVSCRRIGPGELAEIEPHAAGVAALAVADTGIIDYPALCRALVARIEASGGQIRLGQGVTAIEGSSGSLRVTTEQEQIDAGGLINCAGLHTDRVARAAGVDPPTSIVPFRGEYHELVPEARHLCRHLIYPVPDPTFPFLGVHLTRMVGGGVECGPNAVLALAREGYRWRDVDRRDLAEVLGSASFRTLARRHWRPGLAEMWRSLNRRALVRALRRLVPDIEAQHLVPAPSGVRAQALGPHGRLEDDFVVAAHESQVHVLNAPSPAATASLAIADLIVDRLT